VREIVTRILAISGSLRAESMNTAVLRAASDIAPTDVEVVLYDGIAALPHFNPDDDTAERLPAAANALRSEVHAADALMFSVPEYAGALPGSCKNLLDWLIGDDQPGSIYTKPVGWLNPSTRGALGAYQELRTVLGYANARIIDSACVGVPLSRDDLSPAGLVMTREIRDVIATAIDQLVSAAAS
jgi:NAD(P)H-dependent FMN reductase